MTYGTRQELLSATHQIDPNDKRVIPPESLVGSTRSREQTEGGPEHRTHDLQGYGSLRKCFTCGRWFHNEADAGAELEECDGTINDRSKHE